MSSRSSTPAVRLRSTAARARCRSSTRSPGSCWCRIPVTAERILIDPACYAGPGTAEVLPPKPLGRMARKLEEIAAMPVERRPVDLYAALAEVAR